jgi:two-component system sensor histidine kinase/response regulator
MERLQKIEGLEASQGLQRTGGKASFYISMLRKMATAQADAVLRMGKQLAANDRDSAERTAHTLKGVAGNLGAVALQDSASALESALREAASAQDTEACAMHTEQLLFTLVHAMQEYPGFVDIETVPGAAAPASDAERQHANGVLDQIKIYLREDDPAAQTVWEENAALLGSVLAQAQAVREAMEGFEYEVAWSYWPDARRRQSLMASNQTTLDKPIPAALSTSPICSGANRNSPETQGW